MLGVGSRVGSRLPKKLILKENNSSHVLNCLSFIVRVLFICFYNAILSHLWADQQHCLKLCSVPGTPRAWGCVEAASKERMESPEEVKGAACELLSDLGASSPAVTGLRSGHWGLVRLF